MMRFAGFRASSLLQMDALDLLASALVAHLHFLKSGADPFRRAWPVISLWLAHVYPRKVRLLTRIRRVVGRINIMQPVGVALDGGRR